MSIAILPMSQQYGWDSATVGLVQSSFFWGYLLTQVRRGALSTVNLTLLHLGLPDHSGHPVGLHAHSGQSDFSLHGCRCDYLRSWPCCFPSPHRWPVASGQIDTEASSCLEWAWCGGVWPPR